MIYHNVNAKQSIIDKVIAIARQKTPAAQLQVVEQFIQHYYSGSAEEDLTAFSIADLYAIVMSHWHFFVSRKANEVVHIYNPTLPQEGWQSRHTIIELAMPDMPFLVDSLRIVLARHNLAVHLMIYPGGIYATRDTQGHVTEVMPAKNFVDRTKLREVIVYVEIDRLPDPSLIAALQQEIISVFDDVKCVVQDWVMMKKCVTELIHTYETMNAPQLTGVQDTTEFLKWLLNDRFTFLACMDYELEKNDHLRALEKSALGLAKKGEFNPDPRWQQSPEGRTTLFAADKLFLVDVYSQPTHVHRGTAPYCIAVKRFDASGKIIGERRLIGHFTSTAYFSNPNTVPFLRQKVDYVVERSGFFRDSHAGKELLHILETYPRDDLFLIDPELLFDICMGIMHLQWRQRVSLFLRPDPYQRFFSCIIYVPRDRYNSQLRERMVEILLQTFNGNRVEFTPQFFESIFARVHVIVYLAPGTPKPNYTLNEVEAELIESARTWQDNLHDALILQYKEDEGNRLFKKYGGAFPAGYQENYSARAAVHDISHMETLDEPDELGMSFYRPLEQFPNRLHFKLFGIAQAIPLSDVLPILENMGFKVIAEHPYELKIIDQRKIWINEFDMLLISSEEVKIDEVREIFQQTFAKIWEGIAESDGFNRLVLLANLTWRETALLRAYAKFFKQTGFTLSQSYIENTLATHHEIAKKLVRLFHLRFDPALQTDAKVKVQALEQEILTHIDVVSSLDEDRILRRYLTAIKATVRTNFYQTDVSGHVEKSYIAFKVNSSMMPEMPLPYPYFEIFIYSPKVEAVHLRAGKVARGGIRWSDRREDFRTEVLGLMKAQLVKNAVIVPTGAKGGFVPKQLPVNGSREAVMQEVVACYSTFIRGLLDLTDNQKNNKIVPPPQVVRHDEDDPYLVVAADKGTATFSDTANAIAKEYDFWLGDAFASGGSVGYDHKKMAITARGAWESVKRHFRELGKDIIHDTFTVIGIGDMSGDVFGNGMLMSKNIKLVAAFNHQHIFIDPAPDAIISFAERERLFQLPRSTWENYNVALISKGGGVFKRSEKSITLSSEMKSLLQVTHNVLAPHELIQAILRAPVDLLWNGGIGTYVKASDERNEDVGDRSNDALRVNGIELRCTVVTEGGNLGLTQLGRVEYALNGGILYTDFVDNSGGVDCSDHEVNVKILLDSVVAHGELTYEQRNELLSAMTDEVARLVIANNYHQTQAISLAAYRAPSKLDEYARLIQTLERSGQLNRGLEFLPNDEGIAKRKAQGKGLTRPEYAIVLSYSKITLKDALLASSIADEPYLQKYIENAFPTQITTQFAEYFKQHRLRREIIVNQLVALICNTMGANFIKRTYDETSSTIAEVVQAFVVAYNVFDMETTWRALEALDGVVPGDVQIVMMIDMIRLVRRGTRWFLRNRRMRMDMVQSELLFKPGVQQLYAQLPQLLTGMEKKRLKSVADQWEKAHVPHDLAIRVACATPMISALDIIDAADSDHIPIETMAQLYFNLGARLKLDWFREQISEHRVATTWDALARAACKDDLDRQQRHITEHILRAHPGESLEKALDAWQKANSLIVDRWMVMIEELKATPQREYMMFTVALRKLLDLVQATQSYTMTKNKDQ